MRSFRSYTSTLFADKANNCTSDQHKIIASDKVAQHQNLVISAAGRAFLCLREDLKQVGKSFAGSLAFIITARPSQTSRQLAPLKASYSHARAEALITRLVTRTLKGLKIQDTENRKYYSITKKNQKKNQTTCTCRTSTFEKHPTIMIFYINVQERLKEHLKSLVMTMVGLHKKNIGFKSVSSFIS